MLFRTKSFDVLSNYELYELLQLRQQIFVVEQDCPYLDCDGLDAQSFHVLGTIEEQLISYARIIPVDLLDEYVHIGRVVVHLDFRSKGLGHELMQYCIDECNRRFNVPVIKISAQKHLENFYGEHDFTKIGKEYLEDGIPHIAMIKKVEGDLNYK